MAEEQKANNSKQKKQSFYLFKAAEKLSRHSFDTG